MAEEINRIKQNKLATYVYFHCVKIVCIRSCFGPHFSAFELNMERYGLSLRIQFKYGKMQTRITPNTGTFYAVFLFISKCIFVLRLKYV